ncbi:DegQ family serine endoprotease [Chloracidobacterium sp. MS 40/45]|uniref:DegQ family serine endoprotease n=1 Tax=Chloracidobacterium aggregatum TaxID=2851959 RepID=UPI001B8BF151|nr:DegQ family serine endoprotease [Chloracidobacterium aggregatum]QUV99012.1 DegQ family serine endoprotease [Chloracidobacterium sp. MS 40/45]
MMHYQTIVPSHITRTLTTHTLHLKTWLAVGLLAATALLGGIGGTVAARWLTPAAPASTPPPPAADRPAATETLPVTGLSPVVRATLPAVVNISTTKATRGQLDPGPGLPFFPDIFGPLPQQRPANSLGSGVVVSADGYLLTNHHVVDGASDIKVTFADGRSLKARLVGTDPKTDIAVLKVDEKNLPAIPFGDSSQLEVGDFVLAIGNPFDLGQTVTFGIVSALGRGNLGIETYEDFIQTDAAINPGNSGGALVNLQGKLVGINTAIIARGAQGNQGIGFAVPVSMARMVMEQLITKGRVVRGYLGVTLQDLNEALSKQFGVTGNRGVVITDVTADSPASRAGLQPGDVILEFNGQPVRDLRTLRLTVAQTPPGTTVQLRILRNRTPRDISARLDELPEDQPLSALPGAGEDARPDAPAGSALPGVTVGELSPAVRSRLNLKSGVIVRAVQPGSPAAEAGLQRDDIILQVNQQAVTSVAAFDAAVRQSQGEVLLRIFRGGANLFLVVPRDRN